MAELPRRRRDRSCPSAPTETKESGSGDRTGWRVADTTTPHREHRPRDGQRQVGTARTGMGQPAGWEPPARRGTLSAMTTATAELPLPAGDAALGGLHRTWWRQLGVDTAFVLVGFPLSIVAFVLVVTGLALGLGLIVLWVGAPIWVGTLFTARGRATVGRLRLPAVLGRALPTPSYRAAGPGASIGRRIMTPLREPQYWLAPRARAPRAAAGP